MPTETLPLRCDACAEFGGYTPGMIKSVGICSVCEEEKECAIPLSAVNRRPTSFRQPGTEDGLLAPTVPAAQTQSGEGHFQCPHCEEEISGLHFECSRVIFGHAALERYHSGVPSSNEMTISTTEFEDDDSGDESDYTFRCPECDDELRESEVIWVPHSEDAESPDLDIEPEVDSDEPDSF